MSSATLTADALMLIGLEKSMSPSARIFALAVERADREGVAKFDYQELRFLFGDERDEPAESRVVHNAIHWATKAGLILPGATLDEIRVSLDLVRPTGYPDIGTVYGSLTLIHRVSGDKFLCSCICGSRRTYRLPWLESGITESCSRSIHGGSVAA